jgi:ribosomal protein L2
MATPSPYDTGEVLQPHPWNPRGARGRYGKVDFDNDEGATQLVVKVRFDQDRNTHVLEVEELNDMTGLEILVDGVRVYFGEPT